MGGQRLGVRVKRTGHATKDPPRGVAGKSPIIPIGITRGPPGPDTARRFAAAGVTAPRNRGTRETQAATLAAARQRERACWSSFRAPAARTWPDRRAASC